jgi:hypothetical protein
MALLSVSQLVERTAPPTEDHIALWQRRVRLWSDAGILPTAGPDHGGGTRKRWRYRESTIHLAAVLLRLSDFGVETSIIDRISKAIQRNSKGRGAFSRFWRDAIAGNRNTSYVMFTLDEESLFLFDEHGYGLGTFTLHEEPGLFLNLSGVFEEVRAAETPEEGS